MDDSKLAPLTQRVEDENNSGDISPLRSSGGLDEKEANRRLSRRLVRPNSPFDIALRVAIAFGMGIAFGYALMRSGVMLPAVIRAQFTFIREVMLKMWLSATAVSAFCYIIAYHVKREAFNGERRKRPWGDKGLVTLVVGGFIQGMGMSFTGACPGMVMGQMGAGVPYAYCVYIGGISGALFHLLTLPKLEAFQKRDFRRTLEPFFKTGFLDLDFPARFPRFDVAAVIFILVLAGVIAGFEAGFPWTADLRGVAGARDVSTDLLNPIAAGAIVGALQLPAFFLLGAFLGTSAGYSILCSQWLRVIPDPENRIHHKYSYAAHLVNSASFWQIVYGLGAVLGGWLASATPPALPPGTPGPNGVGPGFGVIGGFLLLFGARMSGGCASGHGLSGLSLFSVQGYVVVAMMYAGAISTSFVLTAIMGEKSFYLD